MKALDNIKDFLYSKDYFINIFENNIHLFNFIKLIEITSDEIKVDFENFKINIKGTNFVVKKMLKNEILIWGKINYMEYIYDK